MTEKEPKPPASPTQTSSAAARKSEADEALEVLDERVEKNLEDIEARAAAAEQAAVASAAAAQRAATATSETLLRATEIASILEQATRLHGTATGAVDASARATAAAAGAVVAIAGDRSSAGQTPSSSSQPEQRTAEEDAKFGEVRYGHDLRLLRTGEYAWMAFYALIVVALAAVGWNLSEPLRGLRSYLENSDRSEREIALRRIQASETLSFASALQSAEARPLPTCPSVSTRTREPNRGSTGAITPCPEEEQLRRERALLLCSVVGRRAAGEVAERSETTWPRGWDLERCVTFVMSSSVVTDPVDSEPATRSGTVPSGRQRTRE